MSQVNFLPEEPLGIVNWRSLQTMAGSDTRRDKFKVPKPRLDYAGTDILAMAWEHALVRWPAFEDPQAGVMAPARIRFAAGTPFALWLGTLRFVLDGYATDRDSACWLTWRGYLAETDFDARLFTDRIKPGAPTVISPPFTTTTVAIERSEIRLTINEDNLALIELRARDSQAVMQLLQLMSESWHHAAAA